MPWLGKCASGSKKKKKSRPVVSAPLHLLLKPVSQLGVTAIRPVEVTASCTPRHTNILALPVTQSFLHHELNKASCTLSNTNILALPITQSFLHPELNKTSCTLSSTNILALPITQSFLHPELNKASCTPSYTNILELPVNKDSCIPSLTKHLALTVTRTFLRSQ
ncbi:hypothetical protein J6590_038705 [Homalodisca vitripennis]|nr:hypothetical protein J6590_038705 [Homalodisca vitripennis]